MVQPAGKTLNTYSDHTGAVHAVAWSHDGKRLASGADDMTVRIWQAV
jgi:WD40 repeat protein